MGQLSVFPKLLQNMVFRLDHQRGARGFFPCLLQRFWGVPPSFGNRNGSLMPALMLTKARQEKNPPQLLRTRIPFPARALAQLGLQ